MKSITFSFALLLAVAFVSATQVQKCKNSAALSLGADDVSLSDCGKSKCVLRRKTDAQIQIKFTPQSEVKDLRQDITAIILDVPLPFPGVYGTSACGNIYDAEGKNKVSCPLKAGETYMYKQSFRVHEFYPTVSLIVHWALNDGQNDVVCFEFPARIK